MVVRLDGCAFGQHLLEGIEGLPAKRALLRSLLDPIDATTPQAIFSLQILRAVSQLERAPISERAEAGIKVAK